MGVQVCARGVVCCLATLSQRLIYLNIHKEPGVVVLQDTTILFSDHEKVSFDYASFHALLNNYYACACACEC